MLLCCVGEMTMKRLLIVILLVMAQGCNSSSDKPDYSLLAEEVLKNTPEYIHWVPGTKFSWCLFERPEQDILPGLTQAVIAKLRKKYILYQSESQMGNTCGIFQDGKLMGYRSGFSFRIRVEIMNQQTIKIHYSDWESGTAGSAHFKVYKWTGKSWKIIEKSGIAVSRLHNRSLQSDWRCQPVC
jgi:hypothetical protein